MFLNHHPFSNGHKFTSLPVGHNQSKFYLWRSWCGLQHLSTHPAVALVKIFYSLFNFILPLFHLPLNLVVLFNWDLPALAWGPLWPANQSPQRLGEAGIWQQSYNGNLSTRMADWRNKIFAMIISLWWQLVNHRENFRTDLAIQRSSPISMPSQGPTLQFKMRTSKLSHFFYSAP